MYALRMQFSHVTRFEVQVVLGCFAGVAWDLQCAAGVLLGVGVAMADLIRQAEGACAERGAALAAAWNLHVAVCDTMMGALMNLAPIFRGQNLGFGTNSSSISSSALHVKMDPF